MQTASGNVAALRAENLGKRYRSGGGELTVLSGVSFRVSPGRSLAIVGPSGSGKTTLLGLCAGLDTPSEGQIWLAGQELGSMSEDARASLRNAQVGFVFQNFQLIPTLTALENVMVPLELRGEGQSRARAQESLQQVGLGDRGHHYPVQLSGGEQQRVALARAFVTRPAILFADEPTGNLDGDTSARIESLLFDLNAAAGTTLILVTHNLALASRCHDILHIKHGRVHSGESPEI